VAVKWVWFSFLVILSRSVSAQVIDNFTDGNFTSNPVWSGTTAEFRVNAQQLQLNASVAGEAYLSTKDTLLVNAQWEFYVRLAFSPSSANFMRFYLVSDKADLSGSLNGYFIQVGEAGNTDGVDLYRQDSLSDTLLIDGAKGRASKTNNLLRIRVTRDTLGVWAVYTDSVGGNNFVPEGQGIDSTYLANNYSGVYAMYTSSNTQGIYWDDIRIAKIVKDTIPPFLVFVQAVDTSSIEVQFTEPVETQSGTDVNNYDVISFGKPVSAVQDNTDKSKIRLVFGKAFQKNVQYSLQVQNIKDPAGNLIPKSYHAFSFNAAVEGDVVINEIFADPTPVIGLPNEEYIEILNTSAIPIPLVGWTLSDGSSTAQFPADTIKPGEYRILTSNSTAFSSYTNVLQLKSFPSLNNAGDKLELRDSYGYLIDQVAYTDAWYGDNVKKNGGYSLERINPLEYCKGAENWTASKAPVGGTPGKKNSVYSNIADKKAPVLLGLAVIDSITLQLQFNEPVDAASATSASYTLNSVSISPTTSLSADRKTMAVTIATAFQNAQTYEFRINWIADCLGNGDSVRVKFTYYKPLPANRFDVIIDEIMSNPKSPYIPVKYCELYNRSNKPISLRGWQFEDAVSSVMLPNYLLMPDSFVVLCYRGDSVALSAFCKNIIGFSNFPTLNSSSDSLFLFDNKGGLIHFLRYTQDWHAGDLKRAGGWSLEMKNSNYVCIPEGNWTSSQNAKGGTPGKVNSVNGLTPAKQVPNLLKVIPEDSVTLRLYFSAPIDSLEAAKPSHYLFTDNSISVTLAEPLFPDYRRVKIHLSKPLVKRKIYGLSIQWLTDCAGNAVDEEPVSFGLPEWPEDFDIVINEMLFNPETGGVDFVELYNRSERIIDLKNLQIATVDEDNAIDQPHIISNEGYLLLPEAYCVLTTSAIVLKDQYYVPNPTAIIEVSGLPGMLDDSGKVVLVRIDEQVIDRVDYSDDWHFSLLRDHEGVSLEKLNPSLPSQDKNSWHSASSTVGYATPTYLNSQYQSLSGSTNNNPFTLDPPVFSPDGDGYQDVLNIRYAFNNPGQMATIEIYNTEGFKIRTLANNVMLGTSGYLNWDGLTDSGEKARIGTYVILINTFTADGETKSYKLVATLVGRF
jgi:hypothetical protein